MPAKANNNILERQTVRAMEPRRLDSSQAAYAVLCAWIPGSENALQCQSLWLSLTDGPQHSGPLWVTSGNSGLVSGHFRSGQLQPRVIGHSRRRSKSVASKWKSLRSYPLVQLVVVPAGAVCDYVAS